MYYLLHWNPSLDLEYSDPGPCLTRSTDDSSLLQISTIQQGYRFPRLPIISTILPDGTLPQTAPRILEMND